MMTEQEKQALSEFVEGLDDDEVGYLWGMKTPVGGDKKGVSIRLECPKCRGRSEVFLIQHDYAHQPGMTEAYLFGCRRCHVTFNVFIGEPSR